jgi:hypothetical protein
MSCTDLFIRRRYAPRPLVFTMHDVSPLTRPDFFAPEVYRRLNPLVRKGLNRARVVLCVSNDAPVSTASVAGMDTNRMRVIPHGVNSMFRPIARESARAEVQEKLGLSEEYILYVGKIMRGKHSPHDRSLRKIYRGHWRDNAARARRQAALRHIGCRQGDCKARPEAASR